MLNPIVVALSENVTRLRKERGWTQTDLGKKIHKSGATISKIESASTWLSPEVLFDLATVLDVTICDLLANRRRPMVMKRKLKKTN